MTSEPKTVTTDRARLRIVAKLTTAIRENDARAVYQAATHLRFVYNMRHADFVALLVATGIDGDRFDALMEQGDKA